MRLQKSETQKLINESLEKRFYFLDLLINNDLTAE